MSNLDKYKGIIPAFYACYDEQGLSLIHISEPTRH